MGSLENDGQVCTRVQLRKDRKRRAFFEVWHSFGGVAQRCSVSTVLPSWRPLFFEDLPYTSWSVSLWNSLLLLPCSLLMTGATRHLVEPDDVAPFVRSTAVYV